MHSFYLFIYLLCVSLCVCVYLHVCTLSMEVRIEHGIPWSLNHSGCELPDLGIELWSSARAVWVLNCGAVSPTHRMNLYYTGYCPLTLTKHPTRNRLREGGSVPAAV